LPPDVIDAHEILMRDARRKMGFALEARDDLIAESCERREETLHRDLDPEVHVIAAIDGAHAALSDLRLEQAGPQDLVAIDLGSSPKDRVVGEAQGHAA